MGKTKEKIQEAASINDLQDKGWERVLDPTEPRDPNYEYEYWDMAGLYLGGFIDKTCGYIRDGKQWSNKKGQIGYLLELEAYLGKEGINHRKAGSGGDSIRSIEYCVTDPRSQIRIVRAHKVMVVSRDSVEELYTKYFGTTPITEETSQFPLMFKTFKSFLKENKQMTKYIKEEKEEHGIITFEFAEPGIPVSKDKVVDPDTFEAKYCNNNIKICDGQFGFEISINVDIDEWNNIMIPSTNDFMSEDPQGLFSKWLFFLNKFKSK